MEKGFSENNIRVANDSGILRIIQNAKGDIQKIELLDGSEIWELDPKTKDISHWEVYNPNNDSFGNPAVKRALYVSMYLGREYDKKISN